MGLAIGTSDSAPVGGWLLAAGRMVGFLTLAGLALGIVAMVVLLPAYARTAYTRYERDCEKVAVAELQATATANERLIAALPNDPVLTKRLALSQGRLTPENEVIVPGNTTVTPPDVVKVVRLPRPDPPSNLLLTAAAKVTNPPTRRGLLLLATGALLLAVFLFIPPERNDRR